jgi:ParB-like chromosome segregation protein Spo0J
MRGLIEDLDASSLDALRRSEIIQAYELANLINEKGLLQPIIVAKKHSRHIAITHLTNKICYNLYE